MQQHDARVSAEMSSARADEESKGSRGRGRAGSDSSAFNDAALDERLASQASVILKQAEEIAQLKEELEIERSQNNTLLDLLAS